MIYRWVTLDCDTCWRVLDPRVTTVSELRKIARSEGWQFSRLNHGDLTVSAMYCPECAAQRAADAADRYTIEAAQRAAEIIRSAFGRCGITTEKARAGYRDSHKTTRVPR